MSRMKRAARVGYSLVHPTLYVSSSSFGQSAGYDRLYPGDARRLVQQEVLEIGNIFEYCILRQELAGESVICGKLGPQLHIQNGSSEYRSRADAVVGQ